MDSLLIHQQANDLVQNFGTRNIKKIALNVGMEVSETDCFHDLLGLFAFQWHDHMIFINQHIDKYTKQMVCGYALGHYLEHPDLNTMKKFIAIKNKHIPLHEQNAFTSHLMLDSNEIYKLTKQGLDAAQIAALKRIHPNCWNCIAWVTISDTTMRSTTPLLSASNFRPILDLMRHRQFETNIT